MNKGIKFELHLFEYFNKSEYKVLGKDYAYIGPILWKDRKVREWKDGVGPVFTEEFAK